MTKFLRTLYNRIVAWMNQPHLRRPIAAMLLLTAAVQMWAAGNGLAGINEATSMVTSYFDPGTKLIYAIGAVVGLIGQGLWQVLVRRSRYQQDRRVVVRSVYLPDCRRDYPAFILPLREWSTISIRG